MGAPSQALGPRSSGLTLSFLPAGSAGSRPGGSAAPPGSPVYLDLAYLPSGSSARLVDEEFFRRVRALCYVISGQDQRKEEGMRAVLDALLAGKQQWDRDLQVCDHPGAPDSFGTRSGRTPPGVFLLNLVLGGLCDLHPPTEEGVGLREPELCPQGHGNEGRFTGPTSSQDSVPVVPSVWSSLDEGAGRARFDPLP